MKKKGLKHLISPLNPATPPSQRKVVVCFSVSTHAFHFLTSFLILIYLTSNWVPEKNRKGKEERTKDNLYFYFWAQNSSKGLSLSAEDEGPVNCVI